MTVVPRVIHCWCLAVGCALTIATSLPAAEPLPHWFPRVAGETRETATYMRCGDCHRLPDASSPTLPRPTSLRYQVLNQIQESNWITKKEMSVWLDHDKHVQAYAVLGNSLSKHMGELLGIPDPTRDRRCLACHSSAMVWEDNVETEPTSKFQLTAQQADLFNLVVGVDCEGCHGPSRAPMVNPQGIKGWIDIHTAVPPNDLPCDDNGKRLAANYWRYFSPEKKRDEFGYVDVRSPATQTQMCLSCHLGDVKMGRIVTHEMFAAGHPPLPAFDVATFRRQMPAHWLPFHKKPEQIQKQFLCLAEGAENPGVVPQTRLLAVGAVTTIRQYLQLFADIADQQETMQPKELRPLWPELSLYECSACHHDLKLPSWRQARPQARPGRPAMKEWCFTVAEFGLELLERDSQELTVQMQPLREELARYPFGRPSASVETSRPIIVWADELATRLENRMWSAEDSRRLLRKVVQRGADATLEYDSARDLYWATVITLEESGLELPAAAPILKALQDQMLVALHDARIGPDGADLQEIIRQDRVPLYPTPRPAFLRIGGQEQELDLLQLDLQAVLKPIAEYQPASVQAQFQKLLALLPTE